MAYDRKGIIRDFVSQLSESDRQTWMRVRRSCDSSLYYYIKDIGGFMPKAGGDISPIIHKPVLDRWQDPNVHRQACFMPRGWRKTTCLTVWANLWEYLQNNEVRILVPSEKEDTASLWILQMANQILRNERLRWVYPELRIVDAAYTKSIRWSSLYLELPRVGIYPEPTIKCVGIRGASQGGHYDIIAPDDLVGEKGFESATVMEDAKRWFDNIEELLIDPDVTRPGASRVRLLGTHWGPGDLGVYIQEGYPEYLWYVVPALKDSSLKDKESLTWLQNPNVADGESNFPEGYSTDYYIRMRANPEKEIVFWSQHMNNPVGASKMTKFDYNWLRWYTFEDRTSKDGVAEKWIVCDDGQEFKVGDFPLFGMIDPGGFAEMRVAKKGSRNAIVIGGQPDTSTRKFVLEVWAGRLKEPEDFLTKIFDLNEKWRVRRWMIEVIGAQRYIFKDIVEFKKRTKRNITILEMPPDVSKGAKDADILGLLDPAANGEIFIHRSMKDFIGEYKSYPNGLTNDTLDMTAKMNKYHWKRRSPEDVRGPGKLPSWYTPDATEEVVAESPTGY